MITLEQALIRVGEELKVAMQQQIKSNGSDNTGALSNSIDYEVRQNGDGYQLVRRMLAYGNYVDQGIGRRPGRRPPQQDILDWIELKRIPVPTGMEKEAFAFIVARRIGEKGTNPRPRPFINNSISKVMRETAEGLIAEGATDEIIQAVNDQLQSVKVTA